VHLVNQQHGDGNGRQDKRERSHIALALVARQVRKKQFAQSSHHSLNDWKQVASHHGAWGTSPAWDHCGIIPAGQRRQNQTPAVKNLTQPAGK
jgi:hypothetical protein